MIGDLFTQPMILLKTNDNIFLSNISMSKKIVKIKTEPIEVLEDKKYSKLPEESDTELVLGKAKKETVVKEKKPFVMTEKRKLAFEKAREKLAEKREKVKQEKEQYENIKNDLKEKIKEKKVKKLTNLKKKVETIEESDSEEEIIVKKRKPRVVYVSDPEIEKPKPQVVEAPRAVTVPPRRGAQYL